MTRTMKYMPVAGRSGRRLVRLFSSGNEGENRYLISEVIVILSVILHYFLGRYWFEPEFFVIFAPENLIATVAGGVGPGLFSVALFLIAEYLLIGHFPRFAGTRWMELGIFASVGATFVWLGEGVRGAFSRMTEAEPQPRQEAHLTAVLNTVPDAAIVVDRDGLVISLNTAAVRQFGYQEDEMAGRSVGILMSELDRPEDDGYIKRYLQAGARRIAGMDDVAAGSRKDGSTFPIKLVVGEARLGNDVCFICFIRDLSEREESEARLQELQSELLRLSRLHEMGEMASTLAHELNQPLSMIANYSQGSLRLLRQMPAEIAGQLLEAQNEIAAQSLRAGEIIRHLREFVMRGEKQAAPEDVRKLVEEAATLALLGSRERGVHASFRFEPGVDAVLTDRIHIQQVLINLMRNAIEAMRTSEKRELTVRTYPYGEFVAVEVSDTGPGISDTISDVLFKPFVTTKAGGMGIGLSISKRIIEAHGGEMVVGRNENGGATFRFTLPIHREIPDDDGG